MRNSVILFYSFLLLLGISFQAGAQGVQKKVIINWHGVQPVQGQQYEAVQALCADGLSNNATKNFTPEYYEKFILPANTGSCDVLITHAEWEVIPGDQLSQLTYALLPDSMLNPVLKTGTERGVTMAMLHLVPLVLNPEGGIMRLKSFTIDLVYIPLQTENAAFKLTPAVSHSVLAKGNWYKIQLNKTGIYKVTYSDLQTMGVDMATVTPGSIRLFGNGGGLLPEANSVPRADDLTENALSVVTANANVFGPGDFFLFYGTGPDRILYNNVSRKFSHSLHIYSDYTYYFLNFDSGQGLRMEDQGQSSSAATYVSTGFTEGIFYEKDLLNLVNSGKDWVGERMDVNFPDFELPAYTFPHIKAGKQAWISYHLLAKTTALTDFTVKINGNTISSPVMTTPSGNDFASERTENKSFFPESDNVDISFRFNGKGEAIGWLDWVELNIPRDLVFTSGQMAFADPASVVAGAVTEFQLQAPSAATTIWEVTKPLKVRRVLSGFQDGICKFVLKTDSIRQFVAFDNTSFLTATFAGKVPNQDLHGIAAANMLIVTHKDYLSQSERLAEHHRITDGYSVTVATNEQVYNEFSSGAPDISAIRDFARRLYQIPGQGKLQFLLLFGDGSFDFKDRIPENTNRVLTFQSKESLSTVESVVSDDFFGLLDENEGNDGSGYIDIGIGRFPVSNAEQAKTVVDKSLFYAGNSEATLGDWRNKLCFVADDGNINYHFLQVEKQICPGIDAIAPVYNLNKIYIDGFRQISTPSGQRCPDANSAIKTDIENGVLVMNYTGHGGEKGWADENILSVREIDSWTNYNHMPVFFTATCEFSRFDNPGMLSAGEHVLLNPAGGSVALFTTTRPAQASTNLGLTESFYDTIFSGSDNNYPRFGNAIAHAKNEVARQESALYIRNFLLLGDPALWLAYPKNRVVTTSINGNALGTDTDTIPAMTPVEVKGMITDVSGDKLTDFNGIVDVKVFDKVRTMQTLGTDPGDSPNNYTVQDNYIYQGRASVTNGDFSVKFIVPRDIDYSFGPGKISYYAHNGKTDANGFTRQMVIGGSGISTSDTTGPRISLFINDLNFINNGITGDTPLLIAQLNDESGINTISNAIGHEIVATLDGNNSASVALNRYYSADLDSYRSGVVKYKFSQLAAGIHTLTLKAWDVFNNSSEAAISFEVIKDIQLNITHMSVFPNPFRDEVKVDFEINLFDAPVTAHLEIFTMNGSLVNSTADELLLTQGYSAGRLSWDGCSISGMPVTPGIYLICIRAKSGTSETVKASRLVRMP